MLVRLTRRSKCSKVLNSSNQSLRTLWLKHSEHQVYIDVN